VALIMNMAFEQKQKMQRGFTLIELIVAFGIFAILVTIASGSFVRSLRIQRVSLQLMAVNDNMAITLEQMTREMRTGYNFCTNSAPQMSLVCYYNLSSFFD